MQKKFIALTLVGILLSLSVGIVIGASVLKVIHYHGTIIDELVNIAFYEDEACTILMEDVEFGSMPLLSEHLSEIYARNEGEVSTVEVRAEILNGQSWILVAPTYAPIDPGQVVKFEVGAIVPATATLGDLDFDLRFYEDDSLPPPAGIPLKGIPGAIFDPFPEEWTAPSDVFPPVSSDGAAANPAIFPSVRNLFYFMLDAML